MSWLSKLMGDKNEAPDEGATTEAGGESASVVSADHGEILAGLRRHLAATVAKGGVDVGAEGIRDDVDLYEAGYLDSLTASEFLVLAEREFGVRLPDWLIGGQANTLDSLARYIENELSSH